MTGRCTDYKAQIPLGSTRLDTFDFVEPVE